MALKANKVNSVDSLNRTLSKKGKGGPQFLTRQKADQKKTVRFMSEPGDGNWIDFKEYFDEALGHYVPLEDTSKLDSDTKVYQRYLTNVVDVYDNRVEPLVLPKTQMQRLMKWYDKYNTLCDRDYELTREGMGFDTTYDAMPEEKMARDMSRFEPIDLWALLEAQLETINAESSIVSDTPKDDDIPFNEADTSNWAHAQQTQVIRDTSQPRTLLVKA